MMEELKHWTTMIYAHRRVSFPLFSVFFSPPTHALLLRGCAFWWMSSSGAAQILVLFSHAGEGKVEFQYNTAKLLDHLKGLEEGTCVDTWYQESAEKGDNVLEPKFYPRVPENGCF